MDSEHVQLLLLFKFHFIVSGEVLLLEIIFFKITLIPVMNSYIISISFLVVITVTLGGKSRALFSISRFFFLNVAWNL